MPGESPTGFLGVSRDLPLLRPHRRSTVCRVSYPAELLGPDETIELEFRPHWTALVAPIAFAVVAVLGVVAAGIWLDGAARVATMVGVVVLWLFLAVKRVLTWMTTAHVITTERLIHRSGILSRRGKEIPLERINDVSFSKTLIERLLGSGDLLIESAGEMGQTRYTDIPDPERLQSLIYQVRERRIVALEGSGGGSVATEIEALARLREQGIVTDEEFQSRKSRLLGT
jgi:membrane protein YdbS with pleckstrin-like domain